MHVIEYGKMQEMKNVKQQSAAAVAAIQLSTSQGVTQQPTIVAGFDRQKIWDHNDSRALS